MIRRADLKLVTIIAADMGFLRELYCVSRDFEMVMYPWSDVEKRSFLEWQFELQHKHYQKEYKGGDFDLIFCKDIKIGRIYVHRQDHDIRLMDITILREYRNRGMGTCLVRELLDEGACRNTRVSLHVEPNNPALRLYERLNFQVKKTEGAYHIWNGCRPKSERLNKKVI